MSYVCNLSPELQKYAKDVLNEDPERREADIENVRQWINQQPHLTARTDDRFILRFLRANKFSLEETKTKIDNFYTIRAMIPEWFKDRDPSDNDLRAILKLGALTPMPQVDRAGRVVFVNSIGMLDPRDHSVNDMLKCFYMIFDVILEEDEACEIMGMSCVVDVQGFSAAHVLAYTAPFAKKSIVLLQDGSPYRPPSLHYINTRSEFETMFNMFKVFFNEETRKLLTVHASDLTPLFNEIPREILPTEYGGKVDMQTIIDDYVRKIDDKRDWLREQEKYGVDESKRPGKPKIPGDFFGYDESILKLNID